MVLPAWAVVALVTLVHAGGIICALEAVMTARTPQGSIAWAVALVAFPYVSLPLYLVLGRAGFWGYVEAMRTARIEGRTQLEQLLAAFDEHEATVEADRVRDLAALRKLAQLPCLRGNQPRLLIDGEKTFGAIFEAIRAATDYVLVQFFIIHDDQIGGQFKELLLRKLSEKVRVYLLYDEVGCRALPRSWTGDLMAAGAEVSGFKARRGWKNRFQLNFRNHRKVVVVDGREAFLGGHNVGDEYLGLSERFGHWRDTHLGVRGPAVQAVQLSFVMDWYWAVRRLPHLEWRPRRADGDAALLLVPTGPADAQNNCELMFIQAAHAARRRLWITSPYFVPSPAVFEALRAAAMRGVEVRIMVPSQADHLLVFLAAFPCIAYARAAGVRVYRYSRGFLHQKVVLIDDDLAAVGTANLDDRSVRLNFEVTMWCADRSFAAQVQAMLEADFADSRLVVHDELAEKGYAFRVATQLARLMDPIL